MSKILSAKKKQEDKKKRLEKKTAKKQAKMNKADKVKMYI